MIQINQDERIANVEVEEDSIYERYVDKRFSIFRIRPNEKIPAERWKKYQTERISRDAARLIWQSGEDNVACACGKTSGIVVIDIDTEDSYDTFIRLCIEASIDPTSIPNVRSGSNRRYKRHFYFRYPPDLPVRKYTLSLSGDGSNLVEVKGAGSYVLLPPSRTTGEYQWMEGQSIFDLELPDLPAFLASLISARIFDSSAKTEFKAEEVQATDAEIEVFESLCEKIGYLKDNADEQSEPEWWSACSQYVALGRPDKAHDFSEGYHKYSSDETERKCQSIRDSGLYPHTCLQFGCENDCGVSAPAALRYTDEFKSKVRELESKSVLNKQADYEIPSPGEPEETDETHKTLPNGDIVAEIDGKKIRIPKGTTQKELMNKTFPKREPRIEGLHPGGTCIMYADEKFGKSSIMQTCGHAVAWGTLALGHLGVKPGTVIYLNSEEEGDIAQQRFRQMLQGKEGADNFIMFYKDEINPADEGGLFQLEYHLKKHRGAFVIMDVIEDYFPEMKKGERLTKYEKRAMRVWLDLCRKYNCDVMVLHHTNKDSKSKKQDRYSGTRSVAKLFDTKLSLYQEDENTGIILRQSRIMASQDGIEVKKDGKGEWWFTGIRNFKLSNMDKRIIHLLKDRPGLTNKEIYEQLETTQSYVSERLNRLKLKGAVRKEGTRKGRWYVTQPDRTITQIETSSISHPDLEQDTDGYDQEDIQSQG